MVLLHEHREDLHNSRSSEALMMEGSVANWLANLKLTMALYTPLIRVGMLFQAGCLEKNDNG